MFGQYLQRNDQWVASWLITCAVVVFGMILLGGVTRLTDSGLSMVEWQPIMGVLPPITEADWQVAFDKYKQFPEFQKINSTMDMAGFKLIFMYEYLHRVLGRLIGLLFAVPLVVFTLRGMLPRGWLPKLTGLLVLGGCQGLLGWYMVQSGLIDRPDVSQYRLTAHLGLAVAIYAAIVWLAVDLTAPHRQSHRGSPIMPLVVVALVYLMILSGGFVAGTDAGYAYPTWPLMGDSFVPPRLWADGWISAFEQVTTIHFNHRMFAYFIVAMILTVAVQTLRCSVDSRLRGASWVLLAAVAVQVTLGVSTVLTQVAIPIAAAHQGGAILLLTATLFWAHARRSEIVRSLI